VKKELGPATVLFPQPVLLVGTYGPDGKPDLMNAAWGNICCSSPPCVAVAVRESRLTFRNILDTNAFTVGIPSRKHVEAADYVGLVSGRDRDKFRDIGFTPMKSGKVNAPLAGELPFSLECRLLQHHALGSHTLFIGEIVGIQADEDILGPSGLPDIEKAQAVLYGGSGSRCYFAVGEKLADAFSAGKSLM
jgi:flavin reductase (DIM6/NTAB) family NADH-FMN oxidoreductase RutF